MNAFGTGVVPFASGDGFVVRAVDCVGVRLRPLGFPRPFAFRLTQRQIVHLSISANRQIVHM